MKISNEQLATRLHGILQTCAGWEGDRLAADRKKALDYYAQRKRGDEVKGRSDVVDGTVSAMVEANLAQMADSFDSDAIVEYSATGKDDDTQSELESYTVTSMVMQDNPGYTVLCEAIKDALLLRNGWVRVYVDENTVSETIEFSDFSPEALADLEGPGVTNELLEYDKNERTARVRVLKTTRKFLVESEDPANIFYLKDWHTTDVQEIPFIAIRHLEAREKLLRRGFKPSLVKRLRAVNQDHKNDSTARNPSDASQYVPPVDSSQDLIEWYECYVLVDAGKGISERRRIGLGGAPGHDMILENEPVNWVPLATGTAFVSPHRLTGISLYDKLKQNQDINTGLERALLDNAAAVNKNRTAYLQGLVNPDDLADGRINSNIRVKPRVGDVRQAITTFGVADISDGLLKNLNYQRQKRTELGGASLELATGQMQMAGGRIGSQGVDRAFSVMEQLAAHMTKNVAQSLIRNVFLLAHGTIREFFDEPVEVKINGKWQSPVPAQWNPRTRLTVKIGMSPGERARRVGTLAQIVQSQFDLANNDMDDVLVNINGFYKALTDWARESDIPNPEQYYLDPASEESQAALKSKTAAEQAARKEQQALTSMAVGLEQLRVAVDKYTVDTQKQFDYWSETLRAEIEEAKIVGKVTGDLVSQTKFGNEGKSTNGQGRGNDNDPADEGRDS